MLVLVSATAVQRFVKVWRQADAPVPLRRERGRSGTTMAERANARRLARASRRAQALTVAERMERWRGDRRAAVSARRRQRDDERASR